MVAHFAASRLRSERWQARAVAVGRRLVRASVSQLPDFLKQVVVLTFYQGLKQSEIGAILDIPVGTVKSRMHTALARLMQMWEEHAAVKET